MLKYDGLEIDLVKYAKIPNYLREINRNLLVELKKQATIQLVREFRYDNNHIPDYNIRINQQIYLLKYYLAYFLEYIAMYTVWSQIVCHANLTLSPTLKVISIGCGSTCDYLSLHFVLKGGAIKTPVDYWGIDLVQWDYISSDLREKQIIRADISQWIKNNKSVFSSADIIVFPKSIGEMTPNSFEELLQQISSKECMMSSKRISILGSFAKLYHSRDIDRYNRFVETIRKKNNYKIYKRKESNLSIDDPTHGTFTWFYPQEVDFSRLSLENQCNLFLQNDKHCRKCPAQEKLTHHPITKTKYFDYAVTVLEK